MDEWLTTRRAVCPICKQDPTTVLANRGAREQETQEQTDDIESERGSDVSSGVVNCLHTPIPPATNTSTSNSSSSRNILNTMAEPLLDGNE